MEANQIKKSNKSKRKDEHDKLLPDSDSSSDMKCRTCDMHFTDAKEYETHMKSKAHAKMIAQVKFLSKSSKTKDSESESSSDDDDDDANELFCDVCDKKFSGYTSYVAHMNGNIHAKQLKKQKLKEKMINMPELVDQENGENDSDEEILQKPFARCSVCQKSFSGPEPFSLHMKSANHKKKIHQSKVLDVIKTKYIDETKKSDDENEFFNKCKVCLKSFSGAIPYQIHMKSAAHRKELEKLKVAEEMEKFSLKDDTKEGYICKECKKVFTNPIAFKSHLENNSHEKQKAKAALLEFLNSYPEIIFTTPLEDDHKESDDDSEENDMGYFLICKLCHTSFSGPESAQDHVKSKKHISIKKQKEVLKLLKKQKMKKSDSATLNGKDNVVSPNEPQNEKSQMSAKNGDDTKESEKDTLERKDIDKTDDFEMI